MKAIKIVLPEKLYGKEVLSGLEDFLESSDKPCISLMFQKLHDGTESPDMEPSFIGMLDGYILKNESPGIKRLNKGYSAKICEVDNRFRLQTRRNGNEIVIQIGSNYYIDEKEKRNET